MCYLANALNASRFYSALQLHKLCLSILNQGFDSRA